MQLEQLIELGLSEEVAKEVMKAHQDAIKNKYVPLARFNDVNEEKKQYKEQVDDLNKKLGELQSKAKNNEEITQQIETLKQQIDDKEKEMESIRKSNAIKLEVLKANPRDINDILPHIDSKIVKIEDGKVTGLEEQLRNLKENKSYLFKEENPAGTGGSKGGGPKGDNEPKVSSLGDALKLHYQK